MAATLFFKGLLLGFSIAAPVGPIGVLCIKRTLDRGVIHGLISGLGTAVADALYGLIAAFGLTAISSFLIGMADPLRLVGGTFLLFLGYRSFTAAPAEMHASASHRGLFGAFASSFVLTLTNPMTILAFVALFAGVGLGSSPENASAWALVAGVFSGSLFWWLFLSGTVHLFRNRMLGERALLWVNRSAGTVLAAFGLAALASFFHGI